MNSSLPKLFSKTQHNSSNVIYGNFSGIPTDLLEELYIFLKNVYKQGETIEFELLCEIFEVHLDDEWNREKLLRGCRYLRASDASNDCNRGTP